MLNSRRSKGLYSGVHLLESRLFRVLPEMSTPHPRHLGAALRQRQHPPRPPGRIHPDRHLGALPEDAGDTRSITSARTTPTARRSCCAPTRRASRPEQLDRPRAGRAHARLRRLPRRHSTTITPRIRRRTRRFCEDIYDSLKAEDLIAVKPVEQFYDPVKADVPAGPLHQGRVPEVRREGPVRRLLRSLRHHVFADRPHRILTRRCRAQSRNARPPTTISSGFPIRAARISCAASPRPATACSRKRQQDEGVVGRTRRQQVDRLGHLPRRALLRLPDPGHRRPEVFLRLAGRAGGLFRQLRQLRRQAESGGQDY